MEKNLPPQILERRLNFLIEIVFFLVLIISPFLFGSVGILALTLIQSGVFFILFLWLLKSINKGVFEFVPLSINKFILLFLLFVLIQYLFINFFVGGIPLGEVYKEKIKNEMFKMSSYLIFFYFILIHFQDRKNINKILASLIITGFMLSVLGIIQKLSGAKDIFWISKTRYLAFFSSFPNRNHFASYINMIIFLTLGIVFGRFPQLRADMATLDKKDIAKGIFSIFQQGIILYVFGLIVMISSLFYCLSRGGIVSFLLGVIFFSILILIKRLTKRGYIFLFIILISTAAMLIWVKAPPEILKRFSTPADSKTLLIERFLGGRSLLATKAIELIKDYPLLGVGFGAFEFIYNKRYNPKMQSTTDGQYFYIDHVHNDPLEFICGVGLIGLAIFCIAAFLYAAFLLKAILRRHDPFSIGVTTGAVTGLFSMCVHSLFDFPFHITSNVMLFFVICALAMVAVTSQIKNMDEVTLLPKRVFLIKNLSTRAAIIVGLMAGFFYIENIIVRPYIAYRISEGAGGNITNLKRAIKLSPLDDKYHFLLAKAYVDKARTDKENARRYAGLASNEVKEAARLNPWNEYYPMYLDWVVSAFKR